MMVTGPSYPLNEADLMSESSFCPFTQASFSGSRRRDSVGEAAIVVTWNEMSKNAERHISTMARADALPILA